MNISFKFRLSVYNNQFVYILFPVHDLVDNFGKLHEGKGYSVSSISGSRKFKTNKIYEMKEGQRKSAYILTNELGQMVGREMV